MPKVSIILTSFNHEKYIREAIDSVLNQTYADFELIIWDDASTDNSWNIIRKYSSPNIKIFRNDRTRRGIYGINKAIDEVASGEYIAIHHSDDVWEHNKLEQQVAFLDKHPEYGAVFSDAMAIGEEGTHLPNDNHFYKNIFTQENRSRHQWLNRFFYQGNALCHPSAMIRKQCFDVCGMYRYGLGQLGDLDMWIRLCLKYEIYVLREKLVRFRVRDNEANTSGNRAINHIRASTEQYLILDNFYNVESFEEITNIFPETRKFYRPDGFHARFLLSLIALDDKSPPWIKLFGLKTLFELINESASKSEIERLYSFDYMNFISVTGKYDLFSVELNNELQHYRERINRINKHFISGLVIKLLRFIKGDKSFG